MHHYPVSTSVAWNAGLRWARLGPRILILRISTNAVLLVNPIGPFNCLSDMFAPEVKAATWPQATIDKYVLSNLEQHGLTANAPASRRDLLRRLSYDLIGLPPSADELDQFDNDNRPDAFERVVDRLLASPEFGEQWGRHWLDVARYSDTKGYVYAREERFFVHAPLYRDWVVRALADDMPYDNFIKLQVAAEQIAPDDPSAQAAMGFLTIGRRFLGVTHDIIDDRIDVVSRGLLGLTVGCARCHDHKFDPIPTADYYSLYGVFQNSIERRVRIPDGRSPEELKGFEEEYLKRQQKYQEQLAAEKKIVNERILSRLGDYLKAQLELDKYPAEGFDVLIQKDDLVPAQLRRFQAFFIDAAIKQEPIFAAWRMFLAIPSADFSTRSSRVSLELQNLPADRMNRWWPRPFESRRNRCSKWLRSTVRCSPFRSGRLRERSRTPCARRAEELCSEQ